MFSFVNTLIGKLDIKESGEFIRISGIYPSQLEAELHKEWGSTRVSQNLITLGRTEFAVHRFLLPDFLFALDKILAKKHISLSRRLLLELVDRLKKETWLKRVFEKKHDKIVDYSKLSKFNFQPLEHQRRYMDFYDDKVTRYGLKGHLLSAVPGAGKTLNSLFLMECLGMDTIVIICPKNALEDVWAKTLENCFKVPVNFWVSSRGKPLEKGYRYYVAHYEQIDHLVNFFKGQGKHFGKIGLVTDEIHNFNDIKSNRTQRLIELAGATATNAEHIVLMSGTPIKAMALETIPMLRMIDPLFTRKAEDIYLKIFGKSTIRALDIMSHRLGFMSFRVEKKEIMSIEMNRYTIKLPLANGDEYTLDTIRNKMKQYTTERVQYYKAHEKEYTSMYETGIAYYNEWLRLHGNNQDKEAFTRYQGYIRMIRKGYDPKNMKAESVYCNSFEKNQIIPRLPQHVKNDFRKAKSVYKYVKLTILGEALGSVLGKIRVACNVDVALNIENVEMVNNETGEKTLVSLSDLINNASKKTIFFTSFVEVVKALADRCTALGFQPLTVYGETNKDLVNITKRFADDKDANPLIATFQSLSTAVPLVMANNVIMLNSPFRPHEYQQAEARAARLGQDSPVDVVDIFLDTKGKPNISTRSKDILQWAAENVAAMLGVQVDVEKDKEDASVVATESLVDVLDAVDRLEEIGLEYLREYAPDTVEEKSLAIEAGKKAYLSW